MKQTISNTLLCNPAAIPAEYEKVAYSLVARYVMMHYTEMMDENL